MNPGVVAADDDPDILLLVSIAIRKAGLELLATASSGDAALAAIREHRPSIVVLDNTMPGMSGLEVCRAIREDSSITGTTVIMLSASVDERAQKLAESAGADHFRSKPFSPREFADFLSVEAAR